MRSSRRAHAELASQTVQRRPHRRPSDPMVGVAVVAGSSRPSRTPSPQIGGSRRRSAAGSRRRCRRCCRRRTASPLSSDTVTAARAAWQSDPGIGVGPSCRHRRRLFAEPGRWMRPSPQIRRCTSMLAVIAVGRDVLLPSSHSSPSSRIASCHRSARRQSARNSRRCADGVAVVAFRSYTAIVECQSAVDRQIGSAAWRTCGVRR